MKNLYLLDTKDETIIHKDSSYFLSNEPQVSSTINSSVVGKNIYITSDEEIQPNDWFIDTVRLLISRAQSLEIGTSQKVPIIICEYHGVYIESNCKKIVMATDLKLIRSSSLVQYINLDFLNWFINKANDSGQPIDQVEISKRNDDCNGLCGICNGSCKLDTYFINNYNEPEIKLTIELSKEEARHLLNCLIRTSAKGKDLDIGEMVEEKLVKFLNQ